MPERHDKPGLRPDPMDEAYLRAERALDDEAGRAARRARILATIARDAEAPAAPVRRPIRRYGGWLAAACVAGLSVWTAQKVYRPSPRQGQGPPAAVTVPAPILPTPSAPVARPPASPSPSIAPQASSAPPPVVARRRSAIAEPVPAPPPADIAPPPPLPLPPVEKPLAQAPAFAPAPSRPPPPAVAAPALAGQAPAPAVAAKPGSATQEAVVVTGSRIQRRDMTAASPAVISQPLVKALDGDSRLREAASNGRAAEIESLLAQGVPVDAADETGETALMKSIEAGQRDAAALLRRHGASLDQKNRAGVSARDMAAKKDDAQLDQALDLSR